MIGRGAQRWRSSQRRIAQITATPVPTDPNFANVAALYHFDDTPGSTTFFDQSVNANHAVRGAIGDTTSTQWVFGGRSLFSSNASSNAAAAATIAAYQFGAGDFTIEFRFRPGELLTTRVFFSMANTWVVGEYTNTANLFLWSSGQITYRNGTDFNSAAGVLTLNAWHAICIERSGGNLRVYVNGTTVIGPTADAAVYGAVSANSPCIKLPSGGLAVQNSYYDELRITNGVARYSGNYTPATAPFPNS